MPLRRSSIVLGMIGAVLIISVLLVELVAVPVLREIEIPESVLAGAKETRS